MSEKEHPDRPLTLALCQKEVNLLIGALEQAADETMQEVEDQTGPVFYSDEDAQALERWANDCVALAKRCRLISTQRRGDAAQNNEG